MSQHLYTNIKALYQTYTETQKPLRNNNMGHCPYIEEAYLLTEGDKIVDFGEMKNMPVEYSSVTTTDVTGKMILPTYVDFSYTFSICCSKRI